mgnify:CR=1 FL=1
MKKLQRELLAPFFMKVLENRTSCLTVVIEDIYQTQNASAVLRTCYCFGLQDIHIIKKTKLSVLICNLAFNELYFSNFVPL